MQIFYVWAYQIQYLEVFQVEFVYIVYYSQQKFLLAVNKKVSALIEQSPKKCPPYCNKWGVRLITVRLSTVSPII